MTIKVTYNVTDVYMSQSVSPVYITVSYSDGGASGGGVWGSITGTLSNQTDLQTALDAKLDESTIDGGTEGQILSKASGTDFDFAWINNYAKYLATNVRNQTGSTIGAFQVVYISGATGNKPLISLADADTEATSSKTYGVTATSIANNGTGDVVTAGELSGIDTSAFNEGDLLWLSTTAGGVVTSPPAEPAHAVFIGYVVRSHPTLGTIDVSIQNGYELNELHGVQITTPTDNQGLFYNSTSTLWENKSITTALGYTPVPTTRNITINGVTYDLSADRTWTISTGISGSGASGQVTYWTGASAVSGDTGLTWDSVNKRLGINTSGQSRTINTFHPTGSPGFNLWAGGGGQSATFASGSQGSYNTSYGVEALLSLTTGAANTAIGYNALRANTTGGVIVAIGADALLSNTTGGGNIAIGYRAGYGTGTNANTTGANNIFIGDRVVGVSATANNRTFIGNTDTTSTWLGGNLLLGTTTDGGQRLQVIGDTLLRGSGNTSATTALTVQNSSSTVLGRFQNDGAVSIGAGGWLTIGEGQRYLYRSVNLSGIFSIANDSNVASRIDFYGSSHATRPNTIELRSSFSPTSGSVEHSTWAMVSTINQTGGANGITRGLYVNPTLTSAADFRAIETTNGKIVFGNLPTSSAGLPTGALWNDAGTVKIV